MRLVAIAVALLVLAVILFFLITGQWVKVGKYIVSPWYGVYAAEVKYRDGMDIMPGQTAQVTVDMEIKK